MAETEVLEPTQDTTEQTGNEATEQTGAEVETQDQSTETAGAEQSQESTYQLPDEKSKVWTDDQLVSYAEDRYPDDAKLLTDPNTPEPTRIAVRRMMHDCLNKDIYIEKLKAGNEQTEEAEEETEEQPEPEIVDPTKQAAEWEQRVTNWVDNVTDPKFARTFTDNFVKAFEIKDPDQRAMAVTKALTRGVVNLMPNLIDAFLAGAPGQKGWIDNYIESRYEGLGDVVKTTSYAGAWETLRTSNEKFKSLPAYNTPEWRAAVQKVATVVPGFENVTFNDPRTGQPLSKYQNFVKKAEIAANILTGQNGSSAIAQVTKAIETGKKQAKDAERTKALGRLGAGNSKGQIQTGAGGDALKDAIARNRAEADPFAGMKSPS